MHNVLFLIFRTLGDFIRKHRAATRNVFGKSSTFLAVMLSRKSRIWPMNSEASTGFACSAKAGRRFIAWNVPAKGVKTKRQFKINVRAKSENQICVARLRSLQKTANFQIGDQAQARAIGRGLEHSPKGASRCLCKGCDKFAPFRNGVPREMKI
jgi:hypothetical protein